MLSIFNLFDAPYALGNPEKKYEYAIWKYFPSLEGKEEANLGIVLFDGEYLLEELAEDFPSSEHQKAMFSRVKAEIGLLISEKNSGKERKLGDIVKAFSREEHFRFGQIRYDYSTGNPAEVMARLFRRYVEH